MRLKSRQQFPPNGWKFYEPKIGENFLKVYNPWLGFSECVQQIITIRVANPGLNLASDIPTVEQELETYTVSRLLSMPGGRDYLLEDDNPPPPVFLSRRPLRQRAGDAAAGAKRVVIGIQTLKDWLGSGLKPVEHAEAENRASICVRCPKNQPGSPLVDAAAETFRRLVEAKNDMKLETSHDEKLDTCAACSCRLTLKVWAPMKHILDHTDSEVRANLWPECWILK